MKTVVVTGAAGGIGQAICTTFKAAGWYVIGIDLRKPAHDVDAFLMMDLNVFAADASYREESLSALKSELPASRLDALVNNAAVQILGATDNLELSDWETSLRINVTAPMLLTQGLLCELEAAEGCVINIGSIHSKLTKRGFVTYATTKAALEGLTRALSVDIGARVRVNLIAPAAIRTPMLEAGFAGDPGALRALANHHPTGVIGEPQEVGALCVNLATAKGPFLNGAIINIDGGISSQLHDPSG